MQSGFLQMRYSPVGRTDLALATIVNLLTIAFLVCFVSGACNRGEQPSNPNAGSASTKNLTSGTNVPEQQSVAANQSVAEPSPVVEPQPGVQPEGHQRMLRELSELRDRTQVDNFYLGDRNVRILRDALDEIRDQPPSPKKWKLQYQLGKFELRLGNEEQALQSYNAAMSTGVKLAKKMPKGSAVDTLFGLGVAFMRYGETENCCRRNSPDSCLLPVRGDGIHIKQRGSRQAIESFQRVLALSSPQSTIHLQARWLLNVAYMTVGEYPQNVPAKYLIPPQAFESQEAFPRFQNIATAAGLDTFSLSGGAIVDDFNNDGLLDLLVSTWAPSGQLRYHQNNGDGSFSERTSEAGLTGLFGGLNMVQADYDNDGDVDVFVLRGAWMRNQGKHPNSLLRNNGNGTFTDVTYESGLGEEHYPTQTAAWSDFDLDGDLDLYVGNEAMGDPSSDQPTKQFAPSQLFQNNGDGTFTDVAEQAGVTNLRYSKAVSWGDFDHDRWPDLYISNLYGQNRLYRNNTDGTFTDVASDLGVSQPEVSFPAWFWDFNNDGNLDLFVAAYEAGIHNLTQFYLDQPVTCESARLYRGTGRGFEDVTSQSGLRQPTLPMGSNFGDLDNDGFLDFYLGTGDPDYRQLMPNVMLRNKAGAKFIDVTTAGGFGHLQKGHAVVFADLDNDGDQDVFEQMGGAFPGDAFYDALYENPGFGHHWISLDLVGVQSNRSAIGARIRVDIVENGRSRTIYKHVNSGGSFGGNPLRQSIGLGQAERIEKLEVFWPATDKTQVFHEIASDRHIRVREDQDRPELLPYKRFNLGVQPAETVTTQ